MNRKLTILLLITIIFITSVSCTKKTRKPLNTEDSIEIEINVSNETSYITESFGLKTQRWHQTNKRVLVMLGYDFNDAETSNNYLYILKDRFGLDSEGGLIYPVIFPDSFKHGTKSYVSDFKEILKSEFKETDLIGVIILGAPEQTHRVLENLQDEDALYFPVFALFPQDENFGMEATCDLIIDKSQKVTDNQIPDAEEGVNQLVALAPEVLINSIEYFLILNEMNVTTSDRELEGEALEGKIIEGFPQDSSMINHVARILKGHTFSNYIDQDTGISAYNHFVIN